MRRFFLVAMLIAAFQIPAFAAGPQLTPGPQAAVLKATIEGRVVRAPNGEPLARAQLTITRVSPPAQQSGTQSAASPGATQTAANAQSAAQANAAAAQGATASIAPVTTDDQGKFQIKDLDPGTYRLFAAHNGFARMEYGQKLVYRPGTPLNLTAGQTMKDVTFRLTPAGTITGRIMDDQGEPVPGISVQALRSTYDGNGKRTLQPAASAKTNDLGEYRLYYVAPGRYYVSASATLSGVEALAAAAAAQAAGGAPTSNEVVSPGYVITYYPNTTDPAKAQAIEVQSGSEISAIHFTMVRQPRFRVRGRVVDAATGQPPMSAAVTLPPRNSAVAQSALDTILGAQAGGNNYNSADGSFELRDISPGTYWLQVLAQGQPAAGAAPNPGGAAAASIASLTTAMIPLEVSGGDIENLTVTTGNGITFPGKIQIEGAASAGFTADRLVLTLLPTNGVVTLALVLQQARPSADGAFSVEKVNAGQYRFYVGGMSPTMYLKSARFDQTDILADGFSVAERSPGSLQVTISANGAQIEGTVLDKDTKPVRGILTVLIPDRNRDRRDLYKGAATDQNGHFNMLGVAPGDYKLFAWEDIEPYSYNDPEVLKQFEDKGKPIHLDELGKETVEVKLIPAVTP